MVKEDETVKSIDDFLMNSEESQRNVLIVDDEEIISRMLIRGLKSQFGDISVLCVKDGFSAIREIESTPYGIVLLDINLGSEGIDGVETLKRIKRIRPDQCVYIITGYEVKPEQAEVIENLAQGFLRKPFENIVQLFDLVGKHCGYDTAAEG